MFFKDFFVEKPRYSWKQMPEDYNASYYNRKDYRAGKKFTIIDNKTKREYQYPIIEKRRTEDGKVYDRTILDQDLCNEEFFAWAISTSTDFAENVGKGWFTPTVLNYVVSHYEFPQIFGPWSTNLLNAMTRDLWNKAFQRNKEVVIYIPKKYVTSDMMNSLGEIKNPALLNLTYEDLTPDLFEKMYFNSDPENKLLLITPAPGRRADASSSFYGGGVTRLISKKIADDILSINIRTIWHIPKEFISKEIAIKAMETDPLLMPYVPAEYHTLKYQKKAIDIKPENLSLIDPSVVTDEMIYYALSKRGSVLGCVPVERRTLEVCDYAISIYGRALRNVPDNVINSQLCFKAVVKDPSAIKFVPVEFLNQEFVNALNTAGVIIPIKDRGYVDECLKVHEKLEGQQLNFKEIVSNTPFNVDSKYSDIRLGSLSGLFTKPALKVLVQNNIFTVYDLLTVSDNSEFYSIILNNPKAIYREIRGAIRLLKCKYLDIDPMITFEDIGMMTFGNEIGFSARTLNILHRYGISPKKLHDIMKSPDRMDELCHIRNSGPSSVEEIIFKTTIVIDYYDKKAEKSKTFTEDETIESLNKELLQVRAEIQRLNARSDEILAKIQEKMLKKGKGGVSK